MSKRASAPVVIVRLIGLIFASFIVVHILALFGIFLAMMYPVWWLLAPGTVPCLLCQTRKAGSYCPFCRAEVETRSLSSPRNFRSSLLNASLVLVISFLSMTMIYFESLLLKNMGYAFSHSTISFEIPPEGQYKINEIFTMPIEVMGVERPINAVQADFVFDPRQLELVEIDTSDSFATVFIQKTIDNQIGYGRLSGGLPNPGFFADRGTFAQAVFKARQAGLATVRFIPSSLVLENDGNGTNLLKDLAIANYLIVPEAISPDEQPTVQSSAPNVPADTSGQVAGAMIGSTQQLVLYDDQPQYDTVLGVTTASEAAALLNADTEEDYSCFSCAIFSALSTVDHYIISFWKNILEAVRYAVTLEWLRN